MADKRILIGEIVTVHGVKGHVKIRSYVEDESLFEGDTVFSSENGSETLELQLKHALKNDWVAEVKGITDRTEAEKLRGTKLYINRDTLPPLDDGEYYIEDLIGLSVIDSKNKGIIGTVLSLKNFGAGDLLEIRPVQGEDYFVLYSPETVIDVDLISGTLTLNVPQTL